MRDESTVDRIFPIRKNWPGPSDKPVNQLVRWMFICRDALVGDAIHHVLSELVEGRIPILTGDNLKYD